MPQNTLYEIVRGRTFECKVIETWLLAQMKGIDVKLCLFTVSVVWMLAEHGQNAKNSMLSKYELGHRKMAELDKHTQKL